MKAAEEYEGEEEDNKLQKSQGTQQNQGSVEDDFEEGQLWPSDGQSTLPQAVADVRCKIAVQLLLVQVGSGSIPILFMFKHISFHFHRQ